MAKGKIADCKLAEQSQNRLHRRTLRPQARFGGQPGRKARLLGRRCADGDDTYREILRQIVCEAPQAECAVCRKILSKGIPKRAAEPSAACGGCSEAEQGRRPQSASAAPRRAARCGNRNPSNTSLRQLPWASVAPFERVEFLDTQHGAASAVPQFFAALCQNSEIFLRGLLFFPRRACIIYPV